MLTCCSSILGRAKAGEHESSDSRSGRGPWMQSLQKIQLLPPARASTSPMSFAPVAARGQLGAISLALVKNLHIKQLCDMYLQMCILVLCIYTSNHFNCTHICIYIYVAYAHTRTYIVQPLLLASPLVWGLSLPSFPNAPRFSRSGVARPDKGGHTQEQLIWVAAKVLNLNHHNRDI